MTDSTNSADATIAATIDSMVAAGAGFDNVSVTPTGGMILDGETGTITHTGPNPTSPSRIQDDGIDVDHAAQQVHARVNGLQAQLDEQVFDAATGKASFKLAENSDAREQLQTRLARERESAGYDIARLNALVAQRNADRIANEAASNEKLAIQSFTNGDPARAAAMRDALLRAEADSAAQAIVNARREGIRTGRR